MLTIKRTLIALKTDRRAVTAVEYAMMIALIATALAATVTTFKTSLVTLFTTAGTSI